MSIKDLFERSTNYISQTDQRDAFADAESSKNVKQIIERQGTFEPQIDYTDPQTFAKYGSAEMYYESAIDRIIDFYPYDGSDAEYNQFYNKSLDIEKYIFNNLYPRTNGYVNFSSSSISFKGGPHTIASTNTKGLFKDPQSSQRETANIYDEDIYTTAGLPSTYGDGTRESNLKCDFTNGITIEFWLKSNELPAHRQDIFHLTNSAGGDDFTIFLDGGVGSGSPFKTTLSASHSKIFEHQVIGNTPTKTTIGDWNHYAVSFKNSDSKIKTKFYINGVLDQETELGSTTLTTLEQSGTLGFIATGSDVQHFQLAASMDEFRFWKVERTAQDIGRNWFGQVRGGTNTDINNTTLGIYYKFNEGITGVSATDSVVLDYSGRVSNGTFAGYTSTSRNTGSAIVSASAATSEYLDPIIYATHPDVSSLRATLINQGIDYDSRNNASFASMMPSWVIEDHEDRGNNNFKYLNHIVGSYFDKIRLQIAALPDFKTPIYTSSSYKPLPFAEYLPASLGLETPQIFIDADVIERFLNKSETENYKFNLNDTKNLIYLNLYNNLTYLFKSKGTQKAIRNVFRAFNIDDKVIRFNTYANNFVYDLDNNLKQTILNDSSANFNNKNHLDAVVYSSGSRPTEDFEEGYIRGTELDIHELHYGMTHEVDVIFPKFIRSVDSIDRNFKRVSLFGIHSASVDLPGTTVFDPSIYVYAERDTNFSKNVKFFLSSSLLPDASPTISSSIYLGAYNDEKWNLSIRLKPSTLDVNGVFGTGSTSYNIEFAGYNETIGEIRNSFKLTGAVDTSEAENILKGAKRIFVGAHRTNVTGALQYKSDVLISATRFWTRYIDDETLQQHALDFENYGIVSASQHLSALDPDNNKTLNSQTLALNYDFGNVTGSDATGGFTVTDISSGSANARNGKFGKLGEISGYLYPGVGFGFDADATDVVIKKQINAHQFINPELVINDKLVQARTEDDELFDTVDTIPNYHFLIEKSMYNAISEEMLNFFAGVNDFHNLIGHPVNQYRMNYKGLEKLREVFFRRINKVSEVEKFIDYYKWFDDSISQIIQQLIPASADYTADVLNTVESHVLERNKYQHRIPIMEFTSSTEGVAFGAEELRYNWNRNHAPVSGLQRDNSNWWKERAEREGTISSGDNTIDSQRDIIRRVQTNETNGTVGRSFTIKGQKYTRSDFKYRTISKGFVYENNISTEIKGGVNFERSKDIHYTYTALHPAGPVNRGMNVFVPRNVLLGFTKDLVALKEPERPSQKVKASLLVQHGREWEGGIGYKSVKSGIAFPFNIVSSSVKSGYNANVFDRVTTNIEITNLHNDVYGPDMERPMQGPFTDYAVGGHQSRHIKLNDGKDNYLNRPEAWKILLGLCNGVTGAIGMVGADYPYPEANERGVSPYPLTGAQKATFYRDEMAKRPVNIRNIQHTTGSTVLGNYNDNYQVVHSVGAFSNPRAFIDQQPAIPPKAAGADVVRTMLDFDSRKVGKFKFIDDYNVGYLTGSGDYKNRTIIRSRFSSPGSLETLTPAFRDLRSGDFSVYNETNNRNLLNRRPFQGVTSSIVSLTTGRRSFDHTGRDFGLTNLSARHAARFFRDSYVQEDTDFANVPRNTPDLNSPGKADDAFTEAPSFHKVHRNNLLRTRNVTSLSASFSGLRLGNNLKLAYNTNAAGSSVINMVDDMALKLIDHITGSNKTISFSSWVQLLSDGDSNGDQRIIYSIGSVEHNPGGSGQVAPLLEIGYEKNSPLSKLFVNVTSKDGSAPDVIGRFTASIATSTLYSTGPNHLVASFIGENGNLSNSAAAKFYFNGVELLTGPEVIPKNNFDVDFSTSYNFRGNGTISRDGKRVFAIGGRSSRSSNTSLKEFSGSIDQLTIWTDGLSQTNVNNLYNSGKPRVITGSEPYLSKEDKLFAWYPLGEEGGDAINASNPASFTSGSNSIFASYATASLDARLFAVSAQGSTATNFFAGTDMAGEAPIQSGYVDTEVEECFQVYDNFNVQHQIPRSDRQYSWFAHSIIHTGTCERRYSGFMAVNSRLAPYYEITGNYFPFFDYVTSSADAKTTPLGTVFQNTMRLNQLITDPTSSQINTLGSSSITSPTGTTKRPLNHLLIHRGDNYGWNWRAFRQQDHKILNIEHKENKITALKNNEIRQFRLPPVSFKGKPAFVNIDANGRNFTLKATHNNEKIYFNQRELNDLVFQTEDITTTPFDQLLSVAQENNMNWVRYSENVFPSTKNEFVKKSRERLDYDNKFWRDDRSARTKLGETLSDSFKNEHYVVSLPYINVLTQSSWPLDAPEDFLTRNEILAPGDVWGLMTGSTSGELQNLYSLAHTNRSEFAKLFTMRGGVGLYSRKHFLTSPNSVVSRTGFANTGSGINELTNTFSDVIKIGAGEALWQAGTFASVVVKTGSDFITASYPSEPWFDEYGDFKKELQLVAKDYAIIPEFRISEHITDYIKGGTFNKFDFDTFEIPGTNISSSQKNFYKDYSNSDFLREFASIKDKSGLNAKEIMLTCKAAVRFNPYKGFYPAQRTLDLVSQFSSSFIKGMSATTFVNNTALSDDALLQTVSLRPLVQPLFAPGILYNSIKSGIAVDYPVINTPFKIRDSTNYSGSNTDGENFLLTPKISFGSFVDPTRQVPVSGTIWDLRVPFETMIEPSKYIDKVAFIDNEPNPSVSVAVTASLDSSVSDGIYELMAKNFFGQTGDFFLKNSSYTKIESDLIQDNLKFKTGDIFAARLKIRKSHNGKRFYTFDSGSIHRQHGDQRSNFSKNGAQAFSGSGIGTEFVEIEGSFPIPQDPSHTGSGFRETFTMYSRPTAFGPSISGRGGFSPTVSGTMEAFNSGTLDSLEGYNWAYTPPYYHGESWVDFIFRPDSDKSYTLEDILTETETVFWRVDPGQKSGSNGSGVHQFGYNPKLIHSQYNFGNAVSATDRVAPIYGGYAINQNAMQISSSINLFGVERVPKKRKDKFGNTILNQNELAGKRWVIQPKWETPMLNFANVEFDGDVDGTAPNNITYPTKFSESVPRGMWHQFGQIPTDPDTGVFLEIGDIPNDWLKYHYDVINEDSIYNNYNAGANGQTAFRDYKSLSDLFGFTRARRKDSAKVRLGEIADKREVYEAVVAIPYIVEANEDYSDDKKRDVINRKKFISIPRPKFKAALKEREGSQEGNSLKIAGESIREMVQKMKRYVLPPQFDFINFEDIEPIVMYFFEFKYEFDKDDLSYIWQNLAPRDYKKITFQEASVAHDLMRNELLEEQDLIDNPNLRWMVFKVKQKAKKDYYDLIPPQIKAARPATALDKIETDKDDEYLQFNWPYDYLSFVELVKLEADVLYRDEEQEPDEEPE